jgi:hypothetical protein
MSNAVPSALELEKKPGRTYADTSPVALLVIFAIVTTAVWAGLIPLASLSLGVSIGADRLFCLSGAIGLFVLLVLSMVAIGRGRTAGSG